MTKSFNLVKRSNLQAYAPKENGNKNSTKTTGVDKSGLELITVLP